MSQQFLTRHIEDDRLNVYDSALLDVKSGPASSLYEYHNPVTNSSSSTAWNVNIPDSKNVVINKKQMVKGTFSCYFQYTTAAENTLTISQLKNVVPSAFPLAFSLKQSTLSLNGTSLSFQNEEIMPTLLKQYSQEYLAENCQLTPNCVDKYYAKYSDASSASSGSYFKGVQSSDLEGLATGRMNSDFDITVYNLAGVAVSALANSTTYSVQVDIRICEPLLGLPCTSLDNSEGGMNGVNNIKINLQYNSLKNVICHGESDVSVSTIYPGSVEAGSTRSYPLSDDTTLVVQTLQPNVFDMRKLTPVSMVPYVDFNSFQGTIQDYSANKQITSNKYDFNTLPDRIFISAVVPYDYQTANLSNHIAFPIKNINVQFNNKSGLLSNMTVFELYEMSKRNGLRQPYSEWLGVVKNENGAELASLGGVIIVDPIRDLNMSEYDSPSGVGSFSFQISVTLGDAIIDADKFQHSVITTSPGVLITQNGSSIPTTSLLNKSMILETLARDAEDDIDHVRKLEGGNVRSGLVHSVKKYAKSHKGQIKKAAHKATDKAVDAVVGGHYSMVAGSKLSKYI